MIYGYINHNKKYYVSFDIDKEDIGGVEKIRVDSSDHSLKMEDMLEGDSDDQ